MGESENLRDLKGFTVGKLYRLIHFACEITKKKPSPNPHCNPEDGKPLWFLRCDLSSLEDRCKLEREEEDQGCQEKY